MVRNMGVAEIWKTLFLSSMKNVAPVVMEKDNLLQRLVIHVCSDHHCLSISICLNNDFESNVPLPK